MRVAAMEVALLPVDEISPDPEQVRTAFRTKALEGLARSIEEMGLLQPVIVHPRADGNGYRLISGERRFRASLLAGKREIRAIVLERDHFNKTQLQLVENLQREDLNPVERALAVHRWMESERMSKRETAKRLGVPRTTLTDWLGVLDVTERHRRALIENFEGGDSPLTLSHVAEAKALAARLGSRGMISVFLDAVVQYRLSKSEAREVAALVKSHEDLDIVEAVNIVRPPAIYEEDEAATRAEETAADQARHLLMALDRVRSGVARMVLGAYADLDEIDRRHVMEAFQRMHAILGDTLRRFEAGEAGQKEGGEAGAPEAVQAASGAGSEEAAGSVTEEEIGEGEPAEKQVAAAPLRLVK